jgi:hypothetical protein
VNRHSTDVSARGPRAIDAGGMGARRSEYSRVVIVRVTRSRIERGHEAHVLDVVRGLTAPFGAIPGLRAAMFGRSVGDRGSMLISITEWADLDAIKAVYGDGWADRSLLPGVEPFILETTVEHFEATLEEVSALVDERRTGPTG